LAKPPGLFRHSSIVKYQKIGSALRKGLNLKLVLQEPQVCGLEDPYERQARQVQGMLQKQ